MFLCDWARRNIAIFNPDGQPLGELLARDGAEELNLPNYPALSADERFLYVSDTREQGPGIWRFDLWTGQVILWLREDCRAANGLALAPDGSALFLVESKLPGITRIPILANGLAGKKEPLVEMPDNEPDGLAFDHKGRLYIAVWHPSRIYRWSAACGLELLIEDPGQDILHHPTNLAFRSQYELFAANLGGWHLTHIDLSSLAS
jgi:sugar lactone lactonase YvrE